MLSAAENLEFSRKAGAPRKSKVGEGSNLVPASLHPREHPAGPKCVTSQPGTQAHVLDPRGAWPTPSPACVGSTLGPADESLRAEGLQPAALAVGFRGWMLWGLSSQVQDLKVEGAGCGVQIFAPQGAALGLSLPQTVGGAVSQPVLPAFMWISRSLSSKVSSG